MSIQRFVPYACLALSMALVGSYVALSKPLVAALPVFLLAWLRFGLGALCMPHWLAKPPTEAPLSAKTRWLLFLESFLGNFLFTLCMLFGVRLTSAVSAGVILAAIPAVVALLSWWFLHERISLRVALAIACAAAGIALLSLSKQELPAHAGTTQNAFFALSPAMWGNVLICGAVLCEAAYAVIGKKLTQHLGPKRITAIINLWGFALTTPLGLYAAWGFDFGSVHTATWALLGFYAFAASVGTVWLWMTGLRTVPAGRAGVFTVMLPVTATLVGVLVLGEPISAMTITALALAVLGIVLATLPGRPVER